MAVLSSDAHDLLTKTFNNGRSKAAAVLTDERNLALAHWQAKDAAGVHSCRACAVEFVNLCSCVCFLHAVMCQTLRVCVYVFLCMCILVCALSAKQTG